MISCLVSLNSRQCCSVLDPRASSAAEDPGAAGLGVGTRAAASVSSLASRHYWQRMAFAPAVRRPKPQRREDAWQPSPEKTMATPMALDGGHWDSRAQHLPLKTQGGRHEAWVHSVVMPRDSGRKMLQSLNASCIPSTESSGEREGSVQEAVAIERRAYSQDLENLGTLKT